MKPLTAREVKKLEKSTTGWKVSAKATKLVKTFTFAKHIDALIFVARVTVSAELMDHYPELLFTKSTVKVTLTTPAVTGLTRPDLILMDRIDRLSTKPVAEPA